MPSLQSLLNHGAKIMVSTSDEDVISVQAIPIGIAARIAASCSIPIPAANVTANTVAVAESAERAPPNIYSAHEYGFQYAAHDNP